jgi:hypothetical protein
MFNALTICVRGVNAVLDGSLGGVLKFLKFPSANVVEFVDFILCTCGPRCLSDDALLCAFLSPLSLSR